MNEVLKQRLVGAAVLASLGVLGWPLLFPAPGEPQLERAGEMPPMPAPREAPLPAPEPVASLPPAGGRHDGALAAEAEALARARGAAQADAGAAPAGRAEAGEPPARPRPALDERGIPVAWVVQVATVSSKDSAEQLVSRLIDSGYKAYFRPLRRAGKTLYRVNVGPRFERRAVEEIRQAIDEELRVSSIIARYAP